MRPEHLIPGNMYGIVNVFSVWCHWGTHTLAYSSRMPAEDLPECLIYLGIGGKGNTNYVFLDGNMKVYCLKQALAGLILR